MMEPQNNASRDRGIALVVVLLAMMLMSALGVALVLSTTAETHIAMNFRRAQEALYAADAAAERAIDDLRAVADWPMLLGGTVQSPFVDGAPTGTRRLDDGSMLDLAQTVNMANCQKPAACTDGDMNATTDDRPWGANNPRWKLFAYGRLRDMLPPGAVDSPYYVIAMVGDDPGENDNDPTRDGGPNNPGAGILALRAEAFGPIGAHRVVELTVARGANAVRVLSWRQLR
jgi:hypothetical protein